MGNRKRKQKHRVVSSNEESTIHPTQGSDSAAPPSSPTLFSTPTASTAATSAATCAAYKNLTTQPPIVHQDMLAKVPLMHQLSLELLAALLPSPPEWERVTVPELNFGIPSSTSHTTPSLDFDVFYKDLSAIAQVLEEFSVDFSTVPNRKLSKDERSALLKEKNLQIVLLVKAAIVSWH
ncbi:hypothetical protein HDU83_006986 [Entophlyctis luteolus]|nr:hypothetical protein HDU83_006986 [Entophlyctis luteolus]